MKGNREYLTGVIFVAAVAVAACGGAATDQPGSASTTSWTTSDGAANLHNQADVMFARHMIPHHQQAIEMSDMLLGKQGIDPEVISLANEIKNAQGPEIATMQGWLQEWGASSSPAPAPTSTAMPGHDMPGHQMPSGDMGDMPGMGGGGHGISARCARSISPSP